MDTRHRLVAAGITLVLGGAVVASAGIGSFTQVSGKKLLIKDNANTSKRKAVWLVKDPAYVPTSPVASGAFVTIVNPVNTGDLCNSTSWNLPASGWTEKNGKFKYVDKTLANGPVKRALLKAGLIKVVAKGSQIDFPLIQHGPQGSVGATLYINGHTACALYPGAQGILKKDDSAKGAFIAVKAEAPASCPTQPGDCFEMN